MPVDPGCSDTLGRSVGTYPHTDIHTQRHAHVPTGIHTHVHLHTGPQASTKTCAYILMNTHKDMHMHLQTHTQMHTCPYPSTHTQRHAYILRERVRVRKFAVPTPIRGSKSETEPALSQGHIHIQEGRRMVLDTGFCPGHLYPCPSAGFLNCSRQLYHTE